MVVTSVALQLFRSPSAVTVNGSCDSAPAGAKCLALLAFLALEPGPHSREELATLLWGESLDSAARASLRQALKRIRDAVGDVVHVDRNAVELVGPIACDAIEFLRCSSSDPVRALEFRVIHFLDGVIVKQAPAFEDWSAAKRRMFLERFELAASLAVQDAVERSDWQAALRCCDAWLECDPGSAEATRRAMEALYMAGDHEQAIARFESHRKRLSDETGSEPSAALQELRSHIEREMQSRSARTSDDGSDVATPSFDSRMVGRDGEWRELMRGWDSVRRGRCRFYLIEGEAGIGKTRLAEEFLNWARADAALVLSGRGYDPTSGVPYGPVAEALRDVVDTPELAGVAPEWLGEVTPIIPELSQRFPGLPKPTSLRDTGRRARLFEGIAQVIIALAEERPTVLFIDDLQWCDEGTCALFHFLTHRFENLMLALVTTLTEGSVDRAASAARVGRALRAHPLTTAIKLNPIGEDDVHEMIREMGQVQDPQGGSRLAAAIHQVTDGNPFYSIELLKTLFDQGVLTTDPATGEWIVTTEAHSQPFSKLDVPPTVSEAISDRVDVLPYMLRDLVAAVSVAGRGVDIDVLSRVHGISRIRTAALADSLVDRRLLTEDAGRYRCAHPVIGEAVRNSLTPARRAEIHRAIALSLEQLVSGDNSAQLAGEVAHHAERGNEPRLAFRFALTASEVSLSRYAFDEALTWLDLAEGAAANPDETREVSERTAKILDEAGWVSPPPPTRRPSGAGGGIATEDLDLRVRESAKPR